MNRFENLDSNKREEILRAALSIFADRGYKDASTNKIVDKAGISKGALFNYFTNKKGLYYYLIDYSLEIIKIEYIDQIDSTTTDFIQRMENNSKIKYKYLQKHPEVLRSHPRLARRIDGRESTAPMFNTYFGEACAHLGVNNFGDWWVDTQNLNDSLVVKYADNPG